MWEDNQKTLKNVATFRGIGLHSGVETRVDLEPAESDSGIIFKRTDVKKNKFWGPILKNIQLGGFL